MHALDQVGLDVLHAGRQIDRDQAGPGARRDDAEIGPADRLGAAPRGALEQPRRRDPGREVVQRRQLAEQVQIGGAGQAVGADRDARAGGEEARRRRAADADPDVAARTRHDRRARLGETGQLGVRALHAVHREQRRPDDAETIEVLDRPARRRRPARIPGAAGVEDVAPAAAPGVQELELVGRFADVDAADRAGPGGARAEQAQHVRRDRVGRVRHDVGGDARRSVRLDVLRRGVDQRGGIGRVEADDLAEDDAVQPAARQRLLAGGGVGDVADRRRARLERVDDRLAHRRAIVTALGEALRHQVRHPRRQRRRRRHLAPQPRQLEMGVRVDQAGQEDAVPEVARLDAGPVRRTAGPERDDTPAGHGDPRVAQRRTGDREHPGGAQAGGHRHRRTGVNG